MDNKAERPENARSRASQDTVQNTVQDSEGNISASSATMKRRLFFVARLVILVLVLGAFAHVLFKAWGQFQNLQERPKIAWQYLLLSLLVYWTALVPPAWFWHKLLRRFGQLPTVYESIRAHICGQPGKYVPGKALVVIIRAALVSSSRTNAAVATAAAFLETLTLMACGAVLSCGFLTWIAWHTGDFTLAAGAVVMLICAGVPTIPAVFLWIVRKIGKRKIAAGLNAIEHLPGRVLILGWLDELLCWCGFAISYWLVLKGIGIGQLNLVQDFPQVLGVVSFAVSAGFMILVLPGGLGVRDLAFIGLMSAYLEPKCPGAGLAMATIASIVLRLVWIIAEASLALILYLYKPGVGTIPPSAPECSGNPVCQDREAMN